MRKSTIKLCSFITACVLLLGTACSKGNDNSSQTDTDISSGSVSISGSASESTSGGASGSQSDSSGQSGSSQSNSQEIPKDTRTPTQIYNDMVVDMAKFDKTMNQEKGKPSFLAGYLYVPGTTISDVVVQYDDNDYFLRRNKYQEDNFNGSYFADF